VVLNPELLHIQKMLQNLLDTLRNTICPIACFIWLIGEGIGRGSIFRLFQ
jgi:hypothetical protein